ncbi:ImmA/IrrE family metallo-endopeptidase [Selenomonas ruminantium]|uniref:IrrE N-terminal-like domain-containing protein n=1 Tax=Selenomonas ruminantium TaxID=971 RepID=A0A1K1M5X5_SELRU|nr:ImmA/IrrE family metallo-endopeptidase [Selenomonas ruminantium]SFW18541.1 protein of unknown function [Selenomonas ruminantium]
MAQSVKRYFKEMHEEEIYEAINDHIQEHPEELKEKFWKLHRMGELHIDLVKIKTVYTDQCPHNMLSFEIVTEASIECKEGDYHYDNWQENTEWFSVVGLGSMDVFLRDFQITMVTIYNGKHHSKNALKDTFVPDIRKENLDSIAEQVLRDYYPEALEHPMPIDTEVLIKSLKLTRIERRISADASVFGQIYFDDVESDFYNEETGRQESMPVKAGTIFVDPMVFFLRNMGSVKNTIIHECVHWLFHRPVFVLEKISDSSLTRFDCAMVGGLRGRSWPTAKQIEWQANALAPRIQMPVSTFLAKAEELAEKLYDELETDSVLEIIEPVIEQLADFFEVSKLSAKIRLVELGCEEARGAFIYVDDHYVQPYIFKEGSLGEHQTFSINIEDALRECLYNGKLRDSENRWDFVYIDSHFVRYSPKYVSNVDGELTLTEYARTHMDECCLIFDMSMDSGCGTDYQTYCFLNRDKDARVKLNIAYANGLENRDEKAQVEAIALAFEDEDNMYEALPRNYPDAMAKMYEESGMKYKEIAKELHISEATIRNVVSGKSGSFETLAGVLLSIQAPPKVSNEIIRMSDWHQKPLNKQHRAIAFALDHLSQHKMSYILDFLHKQGVNF